MNLETTRPRGRPRNRWQDEVREDGSIVGGEEWQEKVYDREEWKKLLRTARNHRILHMPMEYNRIECIQITLCWFMLSSSFDDDDDDDDSHCNKRKWCTTKNQ